MTKSFLPRPDADDGPRTGYMWAPTIRDIAEQVLTQFVNESDFCDENGLPNDKAWQRYCDDLIGRTNAPDFRTCIELALVSGFAREAIEGALAMSCRKISKNVDRRPNGEIYYDGEFVGTLGAMEND